MIVLDSLKYKKNHCTAQFSNGIECKIHFDILIKHGLAEDVQLPEEKFDEIINENQILLGYNAAINYLQRAIKTEKQVADYLIKKQISPENRQIIIDKLKEYKFIDDNEYARAYISSYNAKYGSLKLKQNLYLKGVDEEIIQHHLSLIDNTAQTIYTIAIKYLNTKPPTQENYNKLFRFLLTRGFLYDDVNTVVARIKAERPPQ